jgi:hypothetical protein
MCAPSENKVNLNKEFKEKILKKAHAIISGQNRFWPSDLKGYFIAKHNLEPSKYEKFINKMSKPTSKVISSFIIVWSVSPEISSLFIAKVVSVVPWLSVFGTTFWMTISVSLLSIAVHPILTIAFGTILRGAIATYHVVASKVHYFVISRFCPGRTAHPVNMEITFQNLTRLIVYNKEHEKFYAHPPGREPQSLPPNYVREIYMLALRLEKYNLLLEGDTTRIREAFEEVELDADPTSSFTFTPETNASSDNSNLINVEKLEKQRNARESLEQVCRNAQDQFYHDDLIKQLIEKPSSEAAERICSEMQGLPRRQLGISSLQISTPYASSSNFKG